ncbi:MAG: threonine ammonia-lyase [Clostridiales bacterium]|jgi:threonine dehydratase|nr:threonine ammonia-lyase [Clostridiales bacterium]
MLTLDKIHLAEGTLSGVARKTDMILTNGVAKDCELWLKTENLQRTGSFKLRGAYFKMSQFTQEEKKCGVVACSAGNHAQGVALAAQQFGLKATIFLPSAAPISKIEATRQYNAEIRLSDGVYDDAYTEAMEFSKSTGAVFLHPFDDEEVIAGQATVGLEILKQLPDVDAVVVPVGGGGLLSGISYAVKSIKPSCRVYGVQAAGADSMFRSFRGKERCSNTSASTFADGIAVKVPGQLTYDFCTKYADDIVTVSDDEIATAILTLMERQKLVAEGAGAVSVAAVMFDKLPIKGDKVCAVVSGGNIDVNILSRVINRGLLTSGRLTNLTIKLIDKPGQLKTVSALIADEGANVIRVQYTPGGESMDINGCFLKISMETRDNEHLDKIKEVLADNGFMLCDY